MSFSHLGELWLAGSHGGGITSGIYASTHWSQAAAPGEARWAVGIGSGGVAQGRTLGFASCKPAECRRTCLCHDYFTFVAFFLFFAIFILKSLMRLACEFSKFQQERLSKKQRRNISPIILFFLCGCESINLNYHTMTLICY